MFQLYTEKARRSIFFARYESSQLGAAEINTEHFLLGLLREPDVRDMMPTEAPELIRREIYNETPSAPKTNKRIDMPLSQAMKRVLAYGAEEAEKMNHRHIGTGHQLLGLLREPCLPRGFLTRGALNSTACAGNWRAQRR